ncbi:MAG: alpha/beta fold hydrolase [Verrucomicrobia bacterium]|nr:alpha/beta fold hydrolase [Verrucomicrobiota bacterium]
MLTVTSADTVPTHGNWQTPDGSSYGFYKWNARSVRLKAVVVAIHGLNGAPSDFSSLADHLSQNGYTVYAYDVRGQGADPVRKHRGDLADWRLLTSDARSFVRQVQSWERPRLPVFLYGESMGALIAIHTDGIQGIQGIQGIVLASPVIKFRGELRAWQRLLARVVFAVGPLWRVDLQKFSSGKRPVLVTRDTRYQEQLQHAPYKIHAFTVRFYRNLVAMVMNSDPAARKLQCPVLVLYGGQDIFVAPEAVIAFFKKIGASDKTLHFYPASYHLLTRDFDSKKVMEDVTLWLNAHVRNLRAV